MNTGGGVTELSKWLKKHSTMECLKFVKLFCEGAYDSQQVLAQLIEKGCPRMHDTDVKLISATVNPSAFNLLTIIVPLLKETNAGEGILLSSRSGQRSP